MKHSRTLARFATIIVTSIFFALSNLGVTDTACSKVFPAPGWKDKPDPIASPDAVPGGRISFFAGQYPKTLNYYLGSDYVSAEIFSLLYDTLLANDPITMEFIPGIADRWEVSDDKLKFRFHIDPKAKWSDGRPITAKDIRFTYDVIMNPKNLTGPHKISMERFYPPEVIDDSTIVFTAKSVHWKNLLALGGLVILPSHAFGKTDFNKINFKFPVVSGPYTIKKIDENTSVTLEKRPDWWQAKRPRYKNIFNFKTVKFCFFAERENAYEAFKKGLIDIFPVYTSRIWVRETGGKDFQANRIIKQKIYNKKPVGFQGFAMNMRRFPFNDLRVRKAMALLLDREKMNRTLMYSQYFLHRSYYEDLYDDTHPCPNEPIRFNPKAAAKLLDQAGFKVDPQTGLRKKGKQTLAVRFLTRSAATDKFLAIYSQDLRNAGIKLEIDKKDWAAWAKDMDTFDYQMTWAAWGSGIFKDPEGMWASWEADRNGGANITGFKNPKVDELIREQRTIFDLDKRNEILRKIDQIAYKSFPYVLLWNIDYTRILYWNKFGRPETILSKYGDEFSAIAYWWDDPNAHDALLDSIKNDFPLPAEPEEIRFDEIFSK